MVRLIDVWVIGKVVAGSKGSVTHTRFVAQDITVNRLLEAELQEKNRRLAEANVELSIRNRELDEFVYVVSHDLQEPLRTLIAFSGFLQKDYGDELESEGQEFVRYLVDASRRMRSMIQGLLNLSRAGKVIGEFGMVDLTSYWPSSRPTWASFSAAAVPSFAFSHRCPTCGATETELPSFLQTLLSNGVKYNRSPNPLVEIEATTESGADSPEHALDDQPDPYILIAIKDNGIGIEPEFHKTIFQLFRRLHTREEYEGTGVGLAICNKIVEAHGGQIWVESTPGEGSTFFIQLRSGPTAASRTIPPFTAGALASLHENSVSEVDADESPTI